MEKITKGEKWYFTFTLGGPHPDCYHVEQAEDAGEARDGMIAKFGLDWAFQYTEKQWRVSLGDYRKLLSDGRCHKRWHPGFTLAEMFNLKEI